MCLNWRQQKYKIPFPSARILVISCTAIHICTHALSLVAAIRISTHSFSVLFCIRSSAHAVDILSFVSLTHANFRHSKRQSTHALLPARLCASIHSCAYDIKFDAVSPSGTHRCSTSSAFTLHLLWYTRHQCRVVDHSRIVHTSLVQSCGSL